MSDDKKKKRIFWVMLAAGGLWCLSVAVSYSEAKVLPRGDAMVALILVGLAFLFKWQQKI